MSRSTLTLVVAVFLATQSIASDVDTRIAESRKVVKEFASTLKTELMQGMQSGGPVNAISVCNHKAPEIAATASAATGWDVGRTSLKVRNPANAPDAWENRILENFESQKAKGADITKLEYAETVNTDGKQYFRYMKAIPTAELCVACHGSQLDPALEAKLDGLYPNDKARGFMPGDIRGAFTISQPM
jgi:hypothetical protein